MSLSVIKKLKSLSLEKSKAEKERLRKTWCFAQGTTAWTVDFTCIQKTENYKLQLLTVSDQRSRYLLHAELYLNTSAEIVMRDLEDLFIKYGQPLLIKADNGPEFRMELREHLNDLSVYLLNSPNYYGQFCGAHERIHRTLKTFVEAFDHHQSLTKLAFQISQFIDQYNFQMPSTVLEGKTPADVFLGDEGPPIPSHHEIIAPYEKDGQYRMKFTDRNGHPARLSLPLIARKENRS